MSDTQPTPSRRHFIALVGAAGVATPAWARGAASAHHILVLGDSLSAEYGLARGTGWVALLQQRLAQSKDTAAVTVTNASISGDTTAGGRVRLAALLAQHRPSIVVIELGGNDALRGLPLASTRANLDAMVQVAQTAGAQVLLLGMQIPPNFGRQYAADFAQLYVQVATQRKAALLPFFLQGVADGPRAMDFFQPDRIHPNAQAQPLMLENVWTHLRPLLAAKIAP